MKRIEDYIFDKVDYLIQLTLSKIIRPDLQFDKVTDINEKVLDEFIQIYGIEGIILDVDETLRNETEHIPKCNKKWIEMIKGRLKVIILSNGKSQEIEDYFKSIGIDYIGFAHKPIRRNFLKACKKIDVDPQKVMMIGNSLFDDIYGGNRNNMITTLVKSVEEDER